MTREQNFFNPLFDVVVGARVEGLSGYMKLARYYQAGVFPKLQQGTNENVKLALAFRGQLFEKLYDFFHRYCSRI